MADGLLATAGNGLKIWETGTFTSIYSYSPEVPGLGVNCASWSTDNTGLASILKDEDKVLLTFNRNSKYSSCEFKTEGILKPSYVQFPRVSQSHVYLSSKNEIHYFELAKQRSRKSFTLSSNVSCFTPNQTDTYLAIGCDNGSLVLLNRASNQISAPFSAPKCAGQRITCVKYCPGRASFLGSACESGTVSFWDCNANKNIFNINDHVAPCTSFSFSPINDSLAVSCGLDKKLICHDTKSKRSVFNLLMDQPCTTVDLDTSGSTVAVGSTRGRVLFYDLRNVSKCVKSVQAHNGRVSALSFMPLLDKSNVNLVMSAHKSISKSKLRTQKSVPVLKTVKEESKENMKPDQQSQVESLDVHSPAETDSSVVTTRRDSISFLFSPLREPESSFTGSTPNPTSSKSSSRRVSEVRLSTEGIFSPIRDEQNSLNLSRKTIYTPALSPLTSIQEESSVPPILSNRAIVSAAETVKPKPVEKLCLDTLTEVARSLTCSSSPVFESIHDREGSEQTTRSSEHEGIPLDIESRLSNQESRIKLQNQDGEQDGGQDDLNFGLAAFPGVFLDSEISPPLPNIHHGISSAFHSINPTFLGSTPYTGELNPDSVSSISKPRLRGSVTNPGVSSGADGFNRRYLEEVVSEAMEDWCGGVEQRLLNMHYSLIRILQQHQEDTRVYLEQMTGLEELKRENQLLRKENEELKRFF